MTCFGVLYTIVPISRIGLDQGAETFSDNDTVKTHKEIPIILPPEKYPFGLKMEMAISEVENRVKSMEGLKWERNDVNTITIYDVPFEIRRFCDLICKFRFDGNLYDIYYYEVSS